MQQINKAADSHEIRPLTGIRGVAAIWVVLFHFYNSWTLLMPAYRRSESLVLQGHLGVDLFFILSGFVLSYVYSAGYSRMGLSEYRRFIWFRLARVFPNHLATLAFLAFLVVASSRLGIAVAGDYPLSGLPFQLTMTHAWPYVRGGYWNYPSWSISAEWFAYLCVFPVTWHFLRTGGRATTLILFGYAALALWLFLFPILPIQPCRALFQVSCEFLAGAAFFGAFRQASRLVGLCQRYATGLFCFLLVFLWVSPAESRFVGPVVTLLFPLLLLGLTSEFSLLSKGLSCAFALWLGRVSYALYMSHGISQKLIKIALPAERYATSPFAIRFLVLYANVLLIALGAASLYYVVEIPARNAMRRIATWWSRRSPAASS